jgi:hypothetical protein
MISSKIKNLKLNLKLIGGALKSKVKIGPFPADFIRIPDFDKSTYPIFPNYVFIIQSIKSRITASKKEPKKY